MPRQSRKKSKSSIYHVMLRGNERKNIFIDNEDRKRFLDTLLEKQKEKEYMLYAYCLMDNHVHLLIKEKSDGISRIMRRINISYAYYFNKKYVRVGHVFQDRYKSEAIESDSYFLAAVRYIHNNPVKAGIVNSPSQYAWSSYSVYINKEINSLVKKNDVLDMFSKDCRKAIKLFIDFTDQYNEDAFIDLLEEAERELKRAKAKAIVDDFLKGKNTEMSQIKLDIRLRNELIRELKRKSVSIRQIAEVLGVGRNIIQRMQ